MRGVINNPIDYLLIIHRSHWLSILQVTAPAHNRSHWLLIAPQRSHSDPRRPPRQNTPNGTKTGPETAILGLSCPPAATVADFCRNSPKCVGVVMTSSARIGFFFFFPPRGKQPMGLFWVILGYFCYCRFFADLSSGQSSVPKIANRDPKSPLLTPKSQRGSRGI